MHARKAVLLPILAAAAALSAGLAGAGGGLTARPAAEAGGAGGGRAFLGFELMETKEELKLDYDVKVQDNGGGRMSVTFTLADEGRIKPLTAVDLAVPSSDKSGYYDVVLSLSPFEKDGKKVYVLHLTRDLVERGELNLKTGTMDGKRMLDWRYFRVRFAPLVKAMDEKAAKSPDAPPTPSAIPAAPASPPSPAMPKP